jgi:hypothetical protein
MSFIVFRNLFEFSLYETIGESILLFLILKGQQRSKETDLHKQKANMLLQMKLAA